MTPSPDFFAGVKPGPKRRRLGWFVGGFGGFLGFYDPKFQSVPTVTDAPFSGIAVPNPSCPAPSLIRPASRHAPLSQTILPSSSLSSSSSTPSLFSASYSNPSSSQISPLSFSSLHPSQTHNPNPPIPDIPQLSQTPDVTAGLPVAK